MITQTANWRADYSTEAFTTWFNNRFGVDNYNDRVVFSWYEQLTGR